MAKPAALRPSSTARTSEKTHHSAETSRVTEDVIPPAAAPAASRLHKVGASADARGRAIGRRSQRVALRTILPDGTVGELVESRREPNDADVNALRLLYRLGERFFEARRLFLQSGEALIDAVEGMREALQGDVGSAEWRKLAILALQAAHAFDATAVALDSVGMRATASACRGASLAADECVRSGSMIEWDRALDAFKAANRHDEHGVIEAAHGSIRFVHGVRFGLPWLSIYALSGWREAVRNENWKIVWCARQVAHAFDVYPHDTIGKAAGVTAEAARQILRRHGSESPYRVGQKLPEF